MKYKEEVDREAVLQKDELTLEDEKLTETELSAYVRDNTFKFGVPKEEEKEIMMALREISGKLFGCDTTAGKIEVIQEFMKKISGSRRPYMALLLKRIVFLALEHQKIDTIVDLLKELLTQHIIAKVDIRRGLVMLLSDLEDVTLDAPAAPAQLGDLIGTLK